MPAFLFSGTWIKKKDKADVFCLASKDWKNQPGRKKISL